MKTMARTSVHVRNNRWAIVSVALAIIGVVSLGAGMLLLMAYPPSEGHASPFFSAAAGPILLVSIVVLFTGPASLFSGIVALRQIKRRKGEEKGNVLAWIGVVFGGMYMAIWVLAIISMIFFSGQRTDYAKCAAGTGDLDLGIESCTRAIDSGELSNTFRDCPSCPEMVVIPAGEFVMGSPAGEIGRKAREEGPQHRVTIGQTFALGKYEVTYAEWDACVSDGGCNGYRPKDRGWGRGNRPVIYVSWYDAKAYVAWLSRKTGKRYRLPSEAEWEYAARAGTTTPFHFGSTISSDRANYNGRRTYGSGRKGVYRAKTIPVGSFPSNAFGLHDVHGNVWEWVEDCWNDSYVGAPSDGSAWTSGHCNTREMRGGSWTYGPGSVRSAFPNWNPSDSRAYDGGFRVARTLP